MKIKLLQLSILFSFFAFSVSAQIDNPFSSNDAPKAELGKCYAKCYIPSQYETTTEKVLVKPAATKLKVVPTKFETMTEKVLVKEASTKLVVVPAVYETMTEQVVIQEASTTLVAVAPEYETTTEKVLIKEASTRWTMKKDENCMSANPNDCFVACFEEIPEQYTTYTSSVIKTPATTKTVEVPAKYKTVTRRVLKTPATTKTVEVPAEYTTITKKVVKSPASTTSIDIAAEYKTVTKRTLVKAGEYSDWREVLCSGDVTSDVNRQIQLALMDKGYDIGPAGADNVLGAQSRAALMQYQRDNNLPVGNLNTETLDHLGVKY